MNQHETAHLLSSSTELSTYRVKSDTASLQSASGAGGGRPWRARCGGRKLAGRWRRRCGIATGRVPARPVEARVGSLVGRCTPLARSFRVFVTRGTRRRDVCADNINTYIETERLRDRSDVCPSAGVGFLRNRSDYSMTHETLPL
ncbi:hypothetical protein EVAR_5491_1 [Eumeta japonica]|uniref:Uncharacterized protein n=1 Tax=Eumeta variegata TaxID=151549 RepID=A0A4C1TC84_EUMVA|nr:hypothetical protein EVAR_5491_1 [Eumeta japonica]